MSLKDLIMKRRAYRSFERVEITEDIINEAAKITQLAPSCMNNQPWKFIFVYDSEVLKSLLETLSRGNQIWNRSSSMIIAVISKMDLDCVIEGKNKRFYYQFDTGLATSFLILYLTEIGLVAHPFAGFDPEKAKEVLMIPEDMELLVLIGVGKKSNIIPEDFSDNQKKSEFNRPSRKPLKEFVFLNKYKEK